MITINWDVLTIIAFPRAASAVETTKDIRSKNAKPIINPKEKNLALRNSKKQFFGQPLF